MIIRESSVMYSRAGGLVVPEFPRAYSRDGGLVVPEFPLSGSARALVQALACRAWVTTPERYENAPTRATGHPRGIPSYEGNARPEFPLSGSARTPVQALARGPWALTPERYENAPTRVTGRSSGIPSYGPVQVTPKIVGRPTIWQGNYWTSYDGIIAWYLYVQVKCPIRPTYHDMSGEMGKFGHLVQVGQSTCKVTVKGLTNPKFFQQ